MCNPWIYSDRELNVSTFQVIPALRNLFPPWMQLIFTYRLVKNLHNWLYLVHMPRWLLHQHLRHWAHTWLATIPFDELIYAKQNFGTKQRKLVESGLTSGNLSSLTRAEAASIASFNTTSERSVSVAYPSSTRGRVQSILSIQIHLFPFVLNWVPMLNHLGVWDFLRHFPSPLGCASSQGLSSTFASTINVSNAWGWVGFSSRRLVAEEGNLPKKTWCRRCD